MFLNTKYFGFGLGRPNRLFSKSYQRVAGRNIRIFQLLGGRVYLRVGEW